MARYPHTKLFNNSGRVVALSGPHIQVLGTHGRVLYSTANLPREDQEGVIQSGPIRCSGISGDGRYLATVGDDKQLKVWDLEPLALLSVRALPKKPTSIVLTSHADILVADKFGDIFRYALHPNNARVDQKRADDALASHENPSGGELVLGHASLLTSCLLTPDERFIITADRDEHIRVSWYPEGYVIESYCLGHKKYVSAIHIPTASPAHLISGGGDHELYIWDWMTGCLQRRITVFPTVEPFIRTRSPNRRCGERGNEEAVRPRGKKRDAAKQRTDANSEAECTEVHASPAGSNDISTTSMPVFVVGKISTFRCGGEVHVVFSAVGATAIFEFALTEADSQLDIRNYDFGKPVIDFIVCGQGTIWALLDADFVEHDVADEPARKLVQAVQWSVDQFVDVDGSVLLDSLNTTCSLAATSENLKALDLYADLSSLPKSNDTERGSHAPERTIGDAMEDESTEEVLSGDVGLTKRALGRLKHKRALNELHQEKLDSRDMPDPHSKKLKADSDGEDP